MKKLLLLSMLLTTIIFMSCKDDNDPLIEDTSVVSFNVGLPELPDADAAPTKVANVARYILSVYHADDLTTVVERVEQAAGTFTVTLENSTNYVCLFWADETAAGNNANGTFDATDLQNVTLNAGQEMTDAFFARLDIVDEQTTFNVTLKRPTARVNIVETGIVALGAPIVVTHSHYDSFSAMSSDVVGAQITKATTITPTVATGNVGSYLTFAPVVGMMMDFSSLYNNLVSNDIPNVPVQANFITNINGRYEDGAEVFTFIVLIDDVWDQHISGVDLNFGTELAPIWVRLADRNAEKGGPYGATVGNTAADYGYYYRWSNINHDSENADKAYSACYNMGEGNGRWRLPTQAEFVLITNRIVYESGELRIQSERGLRNHVVIPLSAFRSEADGFGTTATNLAELGVIANYWSSTVDPALATNGSRTHIYVEDPLNVQYDNIFENGDYGFTVRCIQDM